MDKGFADLCLTTWLRRLDYQTKGEGYSCARCLSLGLRLYNLERETGFEPATSTLARSHSTAELLPLGELDSIRANFHLSNESHSYQRRSARLADLILPAFPLPELQLHHKCILARQSIVVAPPAHETEPKILIHSLSGFV